MKQNRKITPITRFAYGTGKSFGKWCPGNQWFLAAVFLYHICNMPMHRRVIFSLATYLDVIMNPLMGFISDSFIKQNWDANSEEDVSSL